MPPIGLTLQITNVHGWGIYAYHLTIALIRRGIVPLLLSPSPPAVGAPEKPAIAAAVQQYEETLRDYLVKAQAAGQAITVSCRTLHALGNDFVRSELFHIGADDVGSIFFEHAAFSSAGLAAGRRFRRLIAGSRWNAQVLERHGLTDVVVCHQGIDPTIFHPGASHDRFGAGRFVVFSGGQLSLRKGQDIVLAAFARFRQRHPDAILVTAWHSHWPEHIHALAGSPYLSSLPLVNGGPSITAWAVAHGIPESHFVDLGPQPNRAFGDVFRNVHVGLFPNRCEGGTNLVAMECLATGVPCILADNTGQKDLVETIACYPLTRQTAVDPTLMPGGCLEGWGESSVEEIVDLLEGIYTDYAEARRRGLHAADTMRQWGWSLQADRIVDVLVG